ncbi:MAG: hypothetical protein IPP72_12135 [Chitinophagaceae bacterium]|nr:hypothetical protein [Chitinophagaceae bacterium]
MTDTGTFTTKLHLYNPAFYDASPISTTTVFTVNNTADTINFAVHKLGEFKDCSVSLFAAGSIVRPGFPVAYKIKCVNNGTEALTNRSLIFVKDSHLQFQNATISPQSISGDTLVWNLSQLQPDSIISITVNMLADNIPLINLNDTIYSFVSIDTTADYTPADNSAGLRQRVTGSFDPNDKQESHAGVITKLEVQRGNYLNYSIRFQNTGNDTAFNIIVRDSLDEKLSPGDFEMVECSHPYSFKITKGKYITWELPHTNLVDSFHNEPASHGYISYRIKPKAGVAVGDHINNNASIYFDFNLPVETNTETTIVRRTVAVWTGKVNTDWANKENWDINEVPDGEATVIIPASVANSPVVNRNAECYSIQVDPLASITINAGYNLLINGK